MSEGIVRIGDVSWLVERYPAWKSIKSIGIIDDRREMRDAISREWRLYVFSLPPTLGCLLPLAVPIGG
jgi:hypothetical protein